MAHGVPDQALSAQKGETSEHTACDAEDGGPKKNPLEIRIAEHIKQGASLPLPGQEVLIVLHTFFVINHF